MSIVSCDKGRYRRLMGWDYAKGASLFITMATAPRRPLFGKIADGKVIFTPLGKIVDEALAAIPRLNPGISLYGRVIMPDHVHFNCAIAPGLAEPLKILGKAIGRFKVYTTKRAKLLAAPLDGLSPSISAGASGDGRAVPGGDGRAVPGGDGRAVPGGDGRAVPSGDGRAVPSGDGRAVPSGDGRAVPGGDGRAVPSGDGRAVPGQLWRQGYHDWLCLNRRFIDATERYIAYNPLKWQLMHGASGALRIIEPLASPRLDSADYWKGVGNTALLSAGMNLVSLRVSRKVRDIAAVVRRMESAVAKGWVVLSGFISPGERAVLEMLLARNDAKFVRMRPSCIPNCRFRPESAFAAPFAESRYLEIAKGNDETEFGRASCLSLNDEIAQIATAAPGIALYFTEHGLKVLKRNPEKENI